MRVSITVDLSSALTQLNDIEQRQVPFAAKNTLNKLAEKIIVAQQDEMRTVFVNPKPWTLNSLFVREYATKDKLVAVVDFKDSTKNRSAGKYLVAQIQGGGRRTKAIETVFIKRGLMPVGHHIIPADISLDSYGNITLAAFRAMIKGVLAGKYFVLLEPHGKLSAGLYKRDRKNNISALIIYVPEVLYQKRLRYFEIAEQIVKEKQQAIFADALTHALATAR